MSGWRWMLIVTWFLFSQAFAESEKTLEWLLKADYVDACSCDLTCPCIFGGSPTHGYCKGASLVEIKEGNYGQVDLSDITVLAVYNSGSWIKFFVSENATSEQTETVVKFLPIAEGFFDSPVREVRNVPISVERNNDTVRIATEGTVVELELIRGLTGEPIKVTGLPADGFPGLPYLNHTQYKTVTLRHDSEDENYNFSGTNGYTAEIDASDDSVRELKKLDMQMSTVTVELDSLLKSREYCGLPIETPEKLQNIGIRAQSASMSTPVFEIKPEGP